MDHVDENPLFSPTGTLVTRIKGQRSQAQTTKNLPIFYRNLEGALDQRRDSHSLYTIVQNNWQIGEAVDFCSNDILSWNANGALRREFLAELAEHPDFSIGSGGSRLMDGNYPYLEQAEREIAAFHGAEEGLIVSSGFDANISIWTAIPRPGDAIVYDALVHASTHEGIGQSLAMQKVEFEHNDVEAFRNTLLSILDSQPLIKQGKRSIIVAVESLYSMDGDVCPLRELVDVAKEVAGEQANIQFIIDEAHSTGVIGPNAIILGNKTIKATLVNFARSIIFTTAPAFPFIAGIKAGYRLLHTQQGKEARDSVQSLVQWLYFHILFSSICVFPVEYPVVPLGQGRLKITFHAGNTEDQVESLVKAIFSWVAEIWRIEAGEAGVGVSSAAREVYAWMRREGLNGYGMI